MKTKRLILHLTIKRKWFDMILSGEKTEEYREIKDYWARRFLRCANEIEWQVWEEMLEDMRAVTVHHGNQEELMNYFGVKFRKFDAVHFRNGYMVDSPSFTIGLKGIEIRKGKEELGAEKGKYYFVLILGELE